MTTDLTRIDRDEALLAILGDSSVTLDERAAAYAVLQQVRLRIDRALKANRDDIIVGMERQGLKALGPLTVKSTAVDPSYPCNARENWEDVTVQEGMAELSRDERYNGYVHRVPAHLEIDVLALATDVQLGGQNAIDLYRQLNEKGWRREEARRLSLAVREATR